MLPLDALPPDALPLDALPLDALPLDALPPAAFPPVVAEACWPPAELVLSLAPPLRLEPRFSIATFRPFAVRLPLATSFPLTVLPLRTLFPLALTVLPFALTALPLAFTVLPLASPLASTLLLLRFPLAALRSPADALTFFTLAVAVLVTSPNVAVPFDAAAVTTAAFTGLPSEPAATTRSSCSFESFVAPSAGALSTAAPTRATISEVCFADFMRVSL